MNGFIIFLYGMEDNEVLFILVLLRCVGMYIDFVIKEFDLYVKMGFGIIVKVDYYLYDIKLFNY